MVRLHADSPSLLRPVYDQNSSRKIGCRTETVTTMHFTDVETQGSPQLRGLGAAWRTQAAGLRVVIGEFDGVTGIAGPGVQLGDRCDRRICWSG